MNSYFVLRKQGIWKNTAQGNVYVIFTREGCSNAKTRVSKEKAVQIASSSGMLEAHHAQRTCTDAGVSQHSTMGSEHCGGFKYGKEH